MKAMLFAAGKGTRLRPLTNTTPKCLVSIGDKTLLEHNIDYLKAAGVDNLLINVHHLGQQVMDFVSQRDFGIEIQFSEEVELLETGGGLLKAQDFFQNEEAFVVCNSDIYTTLDLSAMIQEHLSEDRLATLAVAERKTSRYLRFNHKGLLCGWENQKTGETISWSKNDYQIKAFQGVQVLSPEIFDYMDGLGPVFSTIPVYLKAAQAGASISAHDINKSYWIDVGTLEKLEQLKNYLKDSK